MKNKIEKIASEAATVKAANRISSEELPELVTCEKVKFENEDDGHISGDTETVEIKKLRTTIQGAAKSIAEQGKVLHDAIVEAIEIHEVSRETIIQWVVDCGYSESRARDLVAPTWQENYGKSTKGKKKGSTKNKDLVQALMKYARNLCKDDAEASKTLRAAQRQIDAARKAAKDAPENVVELKEAA